MICNPALTPSSARGGQAGGSPSAYTLPSSTAAARLPRAVDISGACTAPPSPASHLHQYLLRSSVIATPDCLSPIVSLPKETCGHAQCRSVGAHKDPVQGGAVGHEEKMRGSAWRRDTRGDYRRIHKKFDLLAHQAGLLPLPPASHCEGGSSHLLEERRPFSCRNTFSSCHIPMQDPRHRSISLCRQSDI